MSVDGGAIFPLQILTQNDLPCLQGVAFLDAVLADIVSSDILGQLSGSLASDGPAVSGAVQVEGVEGADQVGLNSVVLVGLPVVGGPVHVGGAAGIVGVGVELGIGVVLALNTGIDVVTNLAAACNTLNGGQGTGVHGVVCVVNTFQVSDVNESDGSLGSLSGLGFCGGLRAAGSQGQNHGQSQQHCQKLFHFLFLLFISFTHDLEPIVFDFTNKFGYILACLPVDVKCFLVFCDYFITPQRILLLFCA